MAYKKDRLFEQHFIGWCHTKYQTKCVSIYWNYLFIYYDSSPISIRICCFLFFSATRMDKHLERYVWKKNIEINVLFFKSSFRRIIKAFLDSDILPCFFVFHFKGRKTMIIADRCRIVYFRLQIIRLLSTFFFASSQQR